MNLFLGHNNAEIRKLPLKVGKQFGILWDGVSHRGSIPPISANVWFEG